MTAPAARDATVDRAPAVDAAAECARRRAVVVLAGIAAYAAGYLAVQLSHPPAPLYDPVHRVWLVGRHAHGMLMGYFGQVLYAAVAGIAAVILTALATRRRPPGPRATRLIFGLALALMVGVIGYYVVTVVGPLI